MRNVRLSNARRADGQATPAESANGAAANRSVQAKVKRRHRQPSLDAEIRAAAKQIAATGMADAMRAGMLIVCARKIDETQRKLDEIKSILRVAGISASTQVDVGRNGQANAGMGSGSVAGGPMAQPTGPTCVHCGRPAVRKTKPNAFNPTGSWFCQIHQVLAAEQERDDALDNHLMGLAKSPTLKKKPTVVQTHPVEMRQPAQETEQVIEEGQETEIQPTESMGPPAGSASVEDAMAALGLHGVNGQ